MGRLTAEERREIPTKEFAGPDRSYPIQDRSHAANAKARAKQQLDAGHISRAEYDSICAKADRKLGRHMTTREALQSAKHRVESGETY